MSAAIPTSHTNDGIWHKVRALLGAAEGTQTCRLPTAEPERRVPAR